MNEIVMETTCLLCGQVFRYPPSSNPVVCGDCLTAGLIDHPDAVEAAEAIDDGDVAPVGDDDVPW